MKTIAGLPIIIIAILSHVNVLAFNKLYINELTASNAESYIDDNGESPDWIEIYNPNDFAINMEGWRISDEDDFNSAWSFPDIKIDAGAYLTVCASGENYTPPDIYISEAAGKGIIPQSGKDEFRFEYTEISGDCELSICINSFRNYSQWSSGGVILRESLEPFSQFAGIFCFSPEIERMGCMYRDVSNQNIRSLQSDIPYKKGPVYLYLRRHGDSVSCSVTDSENYLLDTLSIYFSSEETLLAGIAVSGADDNKITSVAFSNFYINGEKIDFCSLTKADIDCPLPGNSYKSKGLHTDFKLSARGETISLWNQHKMLVDSMTFPELRTDISYGRKAEDVKQRAFFDEPSPGTVNNTAYKGYAPEPQMSLKGGRYSGTIQIDFPEAEGMDNSTMILYTLDGKIPDNINGYKLWPGEYIEITENTVVRAVCYQDSCIPTENIEYYYLDEKPSLPVFSIVSDYDNFWDSEDGLLLDQNMHSDRIIPIYFEYRDINDSVLYETGASMKLHGHGACLGMPQRSFRVLSDNKYGDSDLEFPFFGDDYIDAFDKILLRNSSQDWHDLLIRDAFAAVLTENLNYLDGAAYTPCVVYINGEYRGITNIRERLDEKVIAAKYDLPEESINMFKSRDFYIFDELINGRAAGFYRAFDSLMIDWQSAGDFRLFVHNNFDIYNISDYVFTEIFIANYDWPVSNIRYWQSDSLDKRWRWLLYDADWSFGLDYACRANAETVARFFDHQEHEDKSLFCQITKKILSDTIMRDIFLNRAADLLNTTFSPKNTKHIADSLMNNIMEEIPRHQEKWEESVENLEYCLTELETFADERKNYIPGQLVEQFNLEGFANIIITSNLPGACSFKVNSVEFTELPDTCIYFQGILIEVTVIPKNGHKFLGWNDEQHPQTETVIIDPAEFSVLEAVFDTTDTGVRNIVINEIMYKPADENDCMDWIEIYNAENRDILLSNWIIKDDNDEHEFIFPEPTLLKAGEYLVICESTEAFESIYPAIDNIIGNIDFGFGREDMVRIYNKYQLLIDSVSYSNISPWDEDADGTGKSLELVEHSYDNTLPESWRVSYNNSGTPGMANSSLAIRETKEGMFEIKAYPNPFIDNCCLNIISDRPLKMNFRILNSLCQTIGSGREISTDGNFTCPLNIETESLPAGLYFVKYDIFYPYKRSGILPLLKY